MFFLLVRTAFAAWVGGVDDDPFGFNAFEARGKLRTLSPEELPHACVLEIAASLEFPPEDWNEQHWRDVLLSTPMEFVRIKTSEEAYFMSVNLREGIGASYEAMFRSPVQRMYEIMGFKRDEEARVGSKLSAKAIGQRWREHTTLSAQSEKVTDYFVECCVAGLFVVPRVRGLPRFSSSVPNRRSALASQLRRVRLWFGTG